MFSPFDDPSYGGGGDIWSTGVFAFESPLKDLLDSNDYTLDDLLEQDELLQELRGLHPQLIDYFGAEEAVAGLQQQQQAKAKEDRRGGQKEEL